MSRWHCFSNGKAFLFVLMREKAGDKFRLSAVLDCPQRPICQKTRLKISPFQIKILADWDTHTHWPDFVSFDLTGIQISM